MVPAARTTVPSKLLTAVMVAVLSGALVAIQGKFNGAFSAAGGGPLLAGWVSYLGTIAAVIVVFACRGKLRTTLRRIRTESSWWWFAVGLGGIPIVISMSWGIPLVGIAVSSVCSIAGQTLTGLVLDRYGVGLPHPIRLSRMRLAAAVVALCGLGLAIVAGGAGASSPLVMVGVGAAVFFSGIALALQNAGNGSVVARTGDALLATLTSSVGGGIVMTLITLAAWLMGAFDVRALGVAEWWMYLGGPVGAAITFTASWSVRRLGVFRLTLAVVTGQMVTALLVDAFSGTPVGPVTVISAAVMVCATTLVVLDPDAQSAVSHEP